MNTSINLNAPWELKKLDANHSCIFDSAGMLVVPRLTTEPGTEGEKRAQLLTAAPELVAALRALWEIRPHTGQRIPAHHQAAWDTARAALAKAGT